MNLDLRLPMGMMFSILGAVLLAFGLATRARPELYTPELRHQRQYVVRELRC